MKILYISNAYLPSEISHSLSIMRVCQAFSDSGHDVLLTGIASTENSNDPIAYYGLKGGFNVLCFYFPKWLYNQVTRKALVAGVIQAFKLRKVIKQFKPDMVYSRLTISELIFVPPNVPLFFESHSLGPLTQRFGRSYIFRWIMKRKNLKRIIVTTDILSEWISKELPNIEVVVARLSAEPPVEVNSADLNLFREKNLQGDFAQNIGYTGYLDTEGLRGTDILCQMAAKMPEIGIHIVGGKPEIVAYWKKYAEDWNQNNNVFFYGYRNPNEIPFFLNLLDVVLAPLQFRPNKRAPLGQNMSPLKLPQYMGYAKAIVASDLHAHREILKEGITALLVHHSDVDAWVSAVQRLLTNPAMRKEFGDKARNDYINEFTPEQRVKRILAKS